MTPFLSNVNSVQNVDEENVKSENVVAEFKKEEKACFVELQRGEIERNFRIRLEKLFKANEKRR